MQTNPISGVEEELESQYNPINCQSDDGKSIILGLGGLLLTIITPLQSSGRGDASGVRLQDVLSDRIECGHDVLPPTTTVKALAEAYINRKKNPTAKIELHRCRISCEFLDDMGKKIAPTATSGDVCNTRSNDVGALNLLEMSDPRASCIQGGFKILLSSEFRAPTMSQNKSSEPPIRVLFVLERGDQCLPVEQLYHDFNQISLERFKIHHNTIAFIVPAQSTNCIKRLNRAGDVIKVALYRPHDKKFSLNKFQFDYYAHENEECHFCSIMCRSSSGGLAEKKRARKDKRVRRTHHDSGESYVMSPVDSGYSLSPQGTEPSYSPATKRSREMSSSDEQSPPPMTENQNNLPSFNTYTSGIQLTQTQPTQVIMQPQDGMIFHEMTSMPYEPLESTHFHDQELDNYFADLLDTTTDGGPVDLLSNTTDGGPVGEEDATPDEVSAKMFDTLDLPEIVDTESSDSEIGDLVVDGCTRRKDLKMDPEKELRDAKAPNLEGEDPTTVLCKGLQGTHIGHKDTKREALKFNSESEWVLPFLAGITIIMIYEIGYRIIVG